MKQKKRVPAGEALTDYVVEQVVKLVEIPSPAGDAEAAVAYLEQELSRLQVSHQRTRRGSLLVTLPGREAAGQRTLTAHVDTLAAMVKEVREDGTLRFTGVGSYALNTVEGEYCTLVTADGRDFRGTVLYEKPSVHVFEKVGEPERKFENMMIRLDAETMSRNDTRKLGLAPGDYVRFDPRLELTGTGFIKSRHLDDKAGAACLLGAIRVAAGSRRRPRQTANFYFSTSEEVGSGAAAGIPDATEELIAVDMGAIGKGQESDEYSVCICAKDTTGPFDYGLRRRLVELCRRNRIPYKVDVYPRYGSDAAVAVRAGLDAKTGLFGPGVSASHSLERTHRKALQATTALILAYLELG
jgi:putative aminopeptidase FrvX